MGVGNGGFLTSGNKMNHMNRNTLFGRKPALVYVHIVQEIMLAHQLLYFLFNEH